MVAPPHSRRGGKSELHRAAEWVTPIPREGRISRASGIPQPRLNSREEREEPQRRAVFLDELMREMT